MQTRGDLPLAHSTASLHCSSLDNLLHPHPHLTLIVECLKGTVLKCFLFCGKRVLTSVFNGNIKKSFWLYAHLLCRNSSSRDRGDRDRNDRDRDRFDRFDSRREDRDRGLDRPRQTITKRSFSRENEERRGGDSRGPPDSVRRVSSMTENRDRGSRERDRSKDTGESQPTRRTVLSCTSKRDVWVDDSQIDHLFTCLGFSVKPISTPAPPPPAPAKPAMSEEELDKKSKSIIEEYLHINDMKVRKSNFILKWKCAPLMTFILCHVSGPLIYTDGIEELRSHCIQIWNVSSLSNLLNLSI